MTRKPFAMTSLRLPTAIDQLWDDLAKRMSMNRTAVIVVALRDLAKKEGVPERATVESATEERETA